MKFGVLKFPGANCDQDAYHTLRDVMAQPTEYLWHQDSDLKGVDCVVVPGGFSYGDYLRCGAIARFSPAMIATQEFASRGGLVIGMCNGFQILCESHLLPGALLRNDNQKFVCKQIHLRTENADTPFTNALTHGQVLQVPIAHGEGKYVCDPAAFSELSAANRVLFRYCAPDGALSDAANPNGSLDHIAGVASADFRILGMMPHPERASDPALGSADGRALFESLLRFWR